MDASFARALLEGKHRRALLASPAMAAILRHRAMVSAAMIEPGAVLAEMIRRIEDRQGIAKVLRYWRGREAELVRCALAARRHLPADVPLDGKIYLAAGYDIGVVSPPDVVLNVAHLHFIKAPAELCHYVTHEVHHLGYLTLRKLPDIKRALRSREHLLRLISFMTQMEGMAVHVAYAPRVAAGALGADADYRVYKDPQRALEVRRKYTEVIRSVERIKVGGVTPALAGRLLTTLSSKDRLWYRYGALVARELELRSGRAALWRSIRQPRSFHQLAAKLMPPR